jgi:hypothetical protein
MFQITESTLRNKRQIKQDNITQFQFFLPLPNDLCLILMTVFTCLPLSPSQFIMPAHMLTRKNTILQRSHSSYPVNLLKPSGFFTYHQVQHSKPLHGARFAFSVSYGSQNRQRTLLHTSLTDGFYNRGEKCLQRGMD